MAHSDAVRILLSLSALLLAASCVSAPPRVVVPPAHVVAPPSPAAPIARPTDWRDWPQTPGDWRYRPNGDGSIATFGTGDGAAFAMQCIRSTREMVLIRYVAAGGAATIRTSSLTRAVSFAVVGDPPGGSVAVRLPVQDPLLDAIGFSRGRFVVEQPATDPLVLPAWPEVERVVEDCRG